MKMSTKKTDNFVSNFTMENVSDFINKYMIQLLYAIVFVLIISLLLIFRYTTKKHNIEKMTTDYYQALSYMDTNDNAKALELLDKIYKTKSADENIRTAAGLQMANILINTGSNDEASEIFRTIYNFKKNDLFFRDLAGLSLLHYLIDQNDTSNHAEIEQLIAKLENPKNPLLLIVKEEKALFELKKGNIERAEEILKEISEEEIDNDTKQRLEWYSEIAK